MKIWRKIEGKDLTLFCLYIPVPPPYFQGEYATIFYQVFSKFSDTISIYLIVSLFQKGRSL